MAAQRTRLVQINASAKQTTMLVIKTSDTQPRTNLNGATNN
ncbi:uncharacterized protein G2W53_025336 [Senna tora]|uniref:Uncharacterized protein n=1 Tax=Senna tora TaxID=362788 RepID=A0A834TEM8_9FABA|nr:uncharacterized protein G2W53_025336 [Senna tora]